ncbi:MAG: NfeD family protein [Spirochaetia bacterium]|nr:NfeD family protein [Spirochaetia bacterium]
MHWIIWVVGGVGLALLEILVPGLVSLFLGVGAVITGLLIAAGWLQDLVTQIFAWIIISLGLFLLFRGQVYKYFPAFERKDAITEDDVMLGKIVEVVEAIEPDNPGRVHVHQSSWKAVATQSIAVGEKVRIVRRDQMTLNVERAN